jgi:hypothetical protein
MALLIVGTNKYATKDISNIKCNKHLCVIDGYLGIDPNTRKKTRMQFTHINGTKGYDDLKEQISNETLTDNYLYKYNPYFGYDSMFSVFNTNI